MATAIALFFFPYPQLACLMAVAIWAFCRAYYFAFYVIEHYVDPSHRFAGLGSFIRYALRQRNDTDTDA
jgi:ABC-type sugar transport system permease subunit